MLLPRLRIALAFLLLQNVVGLGGQKMLMREEEQPQETLYNEDGVAVSSPLVRREESSVHQEPKPRNLKISGSAEAGASRARMRMPASLVESISSKDGEQEHLELATAALVENARSRLASTPLGRRCPDVDEHGRKLQAALEQVMTTANVKVVYVFTPYMYAADQLLPLVCALPGQVIQVEDWKKKHKFPKDYKPVKPYDDLNLVLTEFGVPADGIWSLPESKIKELVEGGKYIAVACNDDVFDWWSHKFGTFTGYLNTYRNTITVSHGIDEDALWSSQKGSVTYEVTHYNGTSVGNAIERYEEYPFPSLLFTKSAARIRPDKYAENAISQHSKIDPNKKTVLLLCKETCGRVHAEDAKAISKDYNLLIAPHPLHKRAPDKLGLPKWAKAYHVDLPEEFPLALPLIDVADVVIGQPGSLMSLATHAPEKKLILLPLVKPNELPKHTMPILDDETAHVMYDWPGKGSWTKVLRDTMEDNEKNRHREEMRKKYFRSWFGCIDGYEDYRTVMLALERNFQLDISDLKLLYYQIHGAHCDIEPRRVLNEG